MAHLSGTVALVTGASSGIGEATALALAAHGATVALAARRADRLEDVASRIGAAGGTAHAIEIDITAAGAPTELVARVVRTCGRLDTLVNNAGVMILGPIGEADVTQWQRMLDLNVTALMACSHAALPHLLAAAAGGPRGVADLVNISSTAGRVARAGGGVYNATKFAVGAFSEALRQEITKRQVRVSLVEPGLTATELQSHNTPEIQAMIKTNFALDDPLQAADIADAVLFVVTRPRHVAVNEMLVRPTQQDR